MSFIFGLILKNVERVTQKLKETKRRICFVCLENYQIRDPQLQSFASFKTFEKFSQDVADAELLGKIKLVQLHGHSITDKIKQLHEKSCSDLTQASKKRTSIGLSFGFTFLFSIRNRPLHST